MSDGPHRTLKLTKPWRDLAECADKDAFSTEEAGQCLYKALIEAGAKLPIKDLIGIFSDPVQGHLFKEKIGELDNMATGCPGREGDALKLGAQQAMRQGFDGDAIVHFAVKSALQSFAESNSLAIEEHWKRETTEQRTFNIREELSRVRSACDYSDVASQVISKASGGPLASSPSKKQGIDEGPSL